MEHNGSPESGEELSSHLTAAANEFLKKFDHLSELEKQVIISIARIILGDTLETTKLAYQKQVELQEKGHKFNNLISVCPCEISRMTLALALYQFEQMPCPWEGHH